MREGFASFMEGPVTGLYVLHNIFYIYYIAPKNQSIALEVKLSTLFRSARGLIWYPDPV